MRAHDVFFFICSVRFLFAAFVFCLQHSFFVCSVSFISSIGLLFAVLIFSLQRTFLFVAFLFCLQHVPCGPSYIQACRVHSGALDELTSQQSTGKCSLLLFFKLGHIALTFLVVIWLVLVQDSVVIKTVNEDLRLSSSPSVPSICGRMYRRKLSERRLRLICDRHYLLL